MYHLLKRVGVTNTQFETILSKEYMPILWLVFTCEDMFSHLNKIDLFDQLKNLFIQSSFVDLNLEVLLTDSNLHLS